MIQILNKKYRGRMKTTKWCTVRIVRIGWWALIVSVSVWRLHKWIMSLRSRALALVEVLLRVPPLFVVDEFLKISLGLPVSGGDEVSILSNVTLDHVDVSDSDGNYYDANFYNAFVFTLMKFLVCCLGKHFFLFDFCLNFATASVLSF